MPIIVTKLSWIEQLPLRGHPKRQAKRALTPAGSDRNLLPMLRQNEATMNLNKRPADPVLPRSFPS